MLFQACKALERLHTGKNIYFLLYPKFRSIKERGSQLVWKAEQPVILCTMTTTTPNAEGLGQQICMEYFFPIYSVQGVCLTLHQLRAPEGGRNDKGDAFVQIKIKDQQTFKMFQVCLSIKFLVDLNVNQNQRKYMKIYEKNPTKKDQNFPNAVVMLHIILETIIIFSKPHIHST